MDPKEPAARPPCNGSRAAVTVISTNSPARPFGRTPAPPRVVPDAWSSLRGRLVVPVLLLIAGCAASPAPPPLAGTPSTAASPPPSRYSACQTETAERIVEEFLTDLSADDAAEAAARFAPAPAFQWYSGPGRLGLVAAGDRAKLREHLQAVAAEMTSVTLWEFDYNGGTQVGNFSYVLTKTDTEGNTTTVVGKGALQCSTGLLVLWSEGGPAPTAPTSVASPASPHSTTP